MKLSLLALILGFFLDLILGDPQGWPHPVRAMGKLIECLERRLRRIFRVTLDDAGISDAGTADFARREFLAGTILAVLMPAISGGAAVLILILAQKIHPVLRLIAETLFCWQLLACKALRRESGRVYERLAAGDLLGARRAVSMIVGRDTQNLDEAGVARAAVETVAENASDGVIAPMFYLALGGAPLGFFYKAVNTMDSMIGYKNERYLYFGRFAARLDDAVNFVPARLSALFLTAAAFLRGLDGKNAWRIFQRDRKNHASPNSAQTEAVMAGALRIRLAGDAWYFGKLHKKKTIGDDIRPVEDRDIQRAGELLYAAAALALLVVVVLKGIWIWMAG